MLEVMHRANKTINTKEGLDLPMSEQVRQRQVTLNEGKTLVNTKRVYVRFQLSHKLQTSCQESVFSKKQMRSFCGVVQSSMTMIFHITSVINWQKIVWGTEEILMIVKNGSVICRSSSGVASVNNWRGEYSYIRVHRP